MTKPAYNTVQEIVIDMWDYCMYLEDEYHQTGSQGTLFKFAVAIMTVQYWEDVLLNMEGYDVDEFYF
jgi:hypothetical protein|tara:strand:+ start:928 stop:1128 length:201 start_codon:yes stop_codon:yes gene_type:complete